MSFSSNGTSSLYKSEVEGEAMGSILTGCICNLPIKERMGCMALGLKWLYGRKMGNLQYLNNAWYDLYTFYCIKSLILYYWGCSGPVIKIEHSAHTVREEKPNFTAKQWLMVGTSLNVLIMFQMTLFVYRKNQVTYYWQQ